MAADRLMKGGAWRVASPYFTVSFSVPPDHRGNGLGFRVLQKTPRKTIHGGTWYDIRGLTRCGRYLTDFPEVALFDFGFRVLRKE